ncbi:MULTISPECIES: MalM family protein [Vibrio]|uniref:MalM family protein n=1 Tax=Vibrio TaxID=662 RepID=UPI000243C0C2|nr:MULTISPECIES: MalM family protein [Vibrio]AEX22322.1 maltose operon periplasmic protein [Vibrio sp. EJY3]BDR13347.1 hypothetical protein VspSTUT11_13230 [Vibrio sp. STUT-A11]
MLRNLLMTGLILGCLSGCQTVNHVFMGNEKVEQLSNKTSNSLKELNALYVEKGDLSEVSIQQQTQRLKAYGVDSPVALYELPSNYEILDLKIQAYYDSKIFAPSVLVIDKKGNILSRIPNEQFQYKSGDLFQTYRQESNVRVTPQVADIPIYVIVYTTAQDASSSSRIWVKKDRTMEEEEVVIPHSYTGRVAIEFDALGKFDTVILANENGLEVKTLEYNTNKFENLFDELRHTIKQGNTQKALDLVDQIQKL